MPTETRSRFRNQLLDSLPAPVADRLAEHLRQREMRKRDLLFNPGDKIRDVIFPQVGAMFSYIALTPDGIAIEVAVTGSEGVVGISPLLGSEEFLQAMVQVPGQGWSLPVAVLRREFEAEPSVRLRLIGHMRFILAQAAQTALCNRLHTVEERLARWLLLCQDRTGSAQLPLTHELMATMLGARRSTVTLSASVLQNAGFIRYTHGKLNIIDQKGLEAAACACHAANIRHAADYVRLLRP
jgi:CRP-like cAMP-binding protein